MKQIRVAGIQDLQIGEFIQENIPELRKIFEPNSYDMLGWLDVYSVAAPQLLNKINGLAQEIRRDGQVFVLIGVGGSNQGARAAIELIGDKKVKVIYAGNNLSAAAMYEIINEIQDKSVYCNVIAKNFKTLEPGVSFRILRDFLYKKYGPSEAARRIIATGTEEGDYLWDISKEIGCPFLPFPEDIGGRYSVLSAVGLLPIAVAGIDIADLLKGADSIRQYIYDSPYDNDVLLYAAARNILYRQGKKLEIFAYFHPGFSYLAKWWVQLFGESEGKDGKGIYPAHLSYSEDLHSMGQYVQDGEKHIIETFLKASNMEPDFAIPLSVAKDGFEYLNGKGLNDLNDAAYAGTIMAHRKGGIPVMEVEMPEINAYYIGQIFYFFMFSCYYSGVLLGVNPFDQPGVEAYKQCMFEILRK